MSAKEITDDDVQMSQYKFITLDNLIVYEDNPRNIQAKHQVDEINKMIRESNPDTNYKQLANLAESIINFGQSPLDNIGVIIDKESGKFITVEGNRRVTALKLFVNPELAEEFPKVRKAFNEIRNKYGLDSLPKGLRCVVFPSFDDAKYWIDLKHTGQNDGVGVRDWKRTQKERFSVNFQGKSPSPAFLLFNYLESNEYFDTKSREQINLINNTTTLERIINDPESRRKLFLEKNDDAFISFNEENAAKLFTLIINDLADGKLPVSKVYDRSKRDEYISHLYKKIGIDEIIYPQDESTKGNTLSPTSSYDGYHWASDDEPGETEEYQSDEDIQEDNDGLSATRGGRPTNRGYNPDNRKKLRIKNDLKHPINHPKPAKLYSELISLDCRKDPVVAGICLRSYVEFTCKIFLTIICKKHPPKTERISTMLEKCIQTLKSRTTDQNIIRQIEAISFNPNGENSEIDQLNSYVHHENHTPLPRDLFTIWDNLSPILCALWNEISEKEKRKNK